jgi:hypothetical protein
MSTRALWAALVVAAVSFAAPAWGHEGSPKHRAVVSARAEPGALVVEVLLMMEIPDGVRARRLRARADVDRSGSLEPLEARALASELGAEVVGGYVLRRQGRALRPAEAQDAASVGPEGALVVAILLRYRVEALRGAPERLSVEVLASPAGGEVGSRPLVVELQAAAPLVIGAASGPVAADAPVVGPLTVQPGAPGAWFELSLPQEVP